MPTKFGTAEPVLANRSGTPSSASSSEQLGRDARPVIMSDPGEEVQVDYGTGPMVRDPTSGRYRRTRPFVLTLGYSRKCVRLLTFHSSTRISYELHE